MNRWPLPILLLLLSAGVAHAVDPDQLQAGDAKRGWQAFRTKGCMICHKVGLGSEESVGPDLARVAGDLNEADLAASMWNHAPQMWEKTSERALSFQPMSDQEATDLFSFISFLRYMEDEGDPQQGRTVLESKSCTSCHSLSGKGGGAAPDITSWSQYVNPLAWLQKMWQHAPQMLDEMRRRGLVWPTFKGEEMVNLIAYVRDLGAKKERLYLRTGDPASGQLLLASKGCSRCHGDRGPGPDLRRTQGIAPTIGAMAGSMWNHAPQMLGLMAVQGMERPSLSPQELADIVAYLFFVRFAGDAGDAKNGEKVFAEKGCAGCHTVRGQEEIPGARPLEGKASVPQMARGLWNHGPTMIEAMRQRGIGWPNLSGREMADLIAFFKEKEEK